MHCEQPHGAAHGRNDLVPECLTAFDASFPLRYAANAVAGEDQVIAPRDLKLMGHSKVGWLMQW